MTRTSTRAKLQAVLVLALAFPQAALAHFIWVSVEPAPRPGESTLRAFFNENPLPDAEFVRYVKDLSLTVDGQVVPSTLTNESRDARWLGKAPRFVDARRDLGVMTKKGQSFRLVYTARAQTEPVDAKAKEAAEGLRVRLVKREGGPVIEVLLDGKPLPKARIRVYPEKGEPRMLEADDQGRVVVEDVARGEAAMWANWVDPRPGTLDGKAYAESRLYATFTFSPAGKASSSAAAAGATAFATMPAPAVNSFGGAVLGKWLYVYSGHVGQVHKYSAEATVKRFRRLNLEDRTTWEELPIDRDLQGVALVSDGKALYRTGGMFAKNKAGEDHDLHSVASFARFDPEAKKWTELAPMPEPRSTHDAVVIGRHLYVAGGWHMKGADEESPFLKAALRIDLDRPEKGWESIPQPFERRALSVGELGGRLYVLGGLVGGGMKVERRVDVYDPKAGTWSRGPDLPGGGRTDGFGTSAFNVAGRLYYSGASGKVYRLSGSRDAWEPVGAWAFPRITHRVLPGPGESLLAVGGVHGGKQAPVIELIDLSVARPVASTSAR